MKNTQGTYHTRQNSHTGFAPSELQQFINDFDNKGSGAIDINGGGQGSESLTGNKPKMVLKDSSKYVKKKPSQKM